MAAAQRAEAEAAAEVARRDRQLGNLPADTARLRFYWQDAADRDLRLKIFYRREEDIRVLAVELEEVDFRLPTAQQRLACEDDFLAELDEGGDLWLAVASQIWEQH